MPPPSSSKSRKKLRRLNSDETYRPPALHLRPPTVLKNTRSRGASEILIPDSTKLLATTPQGQQILDNADSFKKFLWIGPSRAAPNAGKGLFLIAPDMDLFLPEGSAITWYHGDIQYYDENNVAQQEAKKYTIALGPIKSHTSQVIISDPSNESLVGCAHFINHSQKPNCRLKYLTGACGVSAVLITLNQNILLRKGKKLELVIDYGQSAKYIHGIDQKCLYTPQAVDIEDVELQNPAMEGVISYFPESVMPKEFKPSDLQMIVGQFLRPTTMFKVFPENTNAQGIRESLADPNVLFLFIKGSYSLQERWILICRQQVDGIVSLFLFDPEGLPYEKFETDWFKELPQNSRIYVCTTWWTYGQSDPHTGAIVIEIAKMLNPFRNGENLEILDASHQEIHPFWKNAFPARIVNIRLGFPNELALSELAKLSIDGKVSILSTPDRKKLFAAIQTAQEQRLAQAAAQSDEASSSSSSSSPTTTSDEESEESQAPSPSISEESPRANAAEQKASYKPVSPRVNSVFTHKRKPSENDGDEINQQLVANSSFDN